VFSKDADIGQFVNPGTVLGVTFATDYAEVRLPLTDQDLAFVNLPAAAVAGSGQSEGPTVRLRATQKGRIAEWDAEIVRSEGVVDERSRVTYAVARVTDPYRLHTEGTPLPIGTFVAASISAENVVDVIRVPRGALRGADELLFVTDENRIEIRKVDVLRSDARYAYISGGASPGERISITSIEAPTNGMSVRTTDRMEPEADSDDKQLASGTEGS
jgi:hypothetical protein